MTFIRISDTVWIRAEDIGHIADNPDERALSITYRNDIADDRRPRTLIDDERDAMLRWLEAHDEDMCTTNE